MLSILSFSKLYSQSYNMGSAGTVTTCTGNFYDSGGPTGQYLINEDFIITFVPSSPGALVRLEFIEFSTETLYDGLQIFNGSTILDPLIPSGLPAGNNTTTCPINSFYGTTTPGTITSTSASGALTLRFRTDGSVNDLGWTALISCVFPGNAYNMTNGNVNTCNGIFYDSGGQNGNYASSETLTYTIFPSSPGNAVSVSFTNFSTEDNYDGLMIYNGPSTASPLISSGLLAGTNPTTCPAGSWRGTGSPGTITSTDATGALTFVFTSDNVIAGTGWSANISCVPLSNQNYVMGTIPNIITTCEGNFYDSGGLNGNYSADENSVLTFVPSVSGNAIRAVFNAFNLESGYDSLFIYNGTSINAPLIGGYSGTAGPGMVTATNLGGVLTFRFKSDAIVNLTGWAASISCVPPQGQNQYSIGSVSTVTTCTGTFFDSGGSGGNYSNNENNVITFFPSTPNSAVSFNFTSFNVDQGWDTLFAYNGSSTAATLIGTFTGTSLPPTITATNLTGAVTFRFKSGSIVNLSGWSANISCAPLVLTPVANFIANYTQIPAGGTVNFFDLSTNDPVTWLWSFPGGNPTTSTLENPTNILYSEPGCYPVSLTVTNAFGSNSITVQCYINVAPADQYYCLPNPTNGTSGGDFINGVQLNTLSNQNTGALNGPAYNFYNTVFTPINTGQSYPLVVQSGQYPTSVYAAWIDYNSDGDFADLGEKLGEFTSAIAFTNYTINFTVPAGTTPGYKIMRVRCAWAANNGATNMNPCTDYAYGETEDYIVQINVPQAAPAVAFTSNEQFINVGNTVNFFDLSANNPTSWSWSFPGGTPSTSNMQNPASIIYNQPGCYQVTLTATNAFGFNSSTQTCYILVSAQSPYCSELHTVSCSSSDNIQSFSITGTTLVNNNSGCTSATSLGYTNYGAGSNYTATLTRGLPYAFNVASASNSNIAMWIDYNQNNVFEASEYYSLAVNTQAYFSYQSGITIPTNAALGSTKIRVRSRDFTQGTITPNDACTLFTSGETEDYTVNIIAQGNAPVASFTISSNSVCAGSCVTITNTSTGQNNTYSWTFPGGTPSSFTGANPPQVCYNNQGVFNITVTVTNPNGSSSSSQAVTVNPIPNVTVSNNTSICQGSSTSLQATSNINGASFVWTPPTGLSNSNVPNPVASPTQTTTYSVVATANGCTSSAGQVTVTVNTVNVSAGNPLNICLGQTAQLQATSSNPGPVTYSWSPTTGLSNPNIANPVASPTQTTIYTVTATSNGCSATASVAVNVNNVVAAVSPNTSICAGSSTPLQASGGTSYLWSPASGLSNPNIANPIASPAQTTTYTVTVTNNGCSATAQVTVTVNTVLASVSQNTTICQGASAQLNASGGTSYQWTPATGLNNPNIQNPIASPLQTTTYTVIVSINQCSATAQVTVNVNNVNANAGEDVTICPGATAQLQASGGGTYQWSPSSGLNNSGIANPVASPSQTTTYTVTVTNNGCSATDAVTVNVSQITATVSPNQSICAGNTVQLNASGGTNYQWTPSTGLSNPNISNPVASPSQTTTYTVTVSSGNCSSTASVVVTVNAIPVVNAGPDISVCLGSSVNLNAESSISGSSFLWSPGAHLSNVNIPNPISTPTSTITYTVTATANGCSSSDQVTINVTNVFANAGQDVSICNGQNTQLFASGGTTYSWTPSAGLSNPNIANPVASPAATTTYIVTVTNNGCSATDAVVVNVTNVNANAGQNQTICSGSSVLLNATGGTTYLWSPSAGLSNPNIANPIASPTVTTTYTVTVINNGCTANAQVTVNVNTVNANAGNNVTICPGASTPLLATGGMQYSWSPSASLNNANIANPIASPSQTTTYTVTVTNAGCTATSQVTVAVNPISVNAGDDILVCPTQGAQLNATANNGATVLWSPATGLNNPNILNPFANPTVNTVYTVTASFNGCTATDQVAVNINNFTANAGLDLTLCQGATAQLNATGGTSYSWSPSTGLSNPNIANPIASPTQTTAYTVVVTNGNCTLTDEVVVTVTNSITANAGNDLTLCSGQTANLLATGGVFYSWSPSTGLSNPNIANPVVSVNNTTTYTVTVTSGVCSSTDEVTVNVVPGVFVNAGTDVSICSGASASLNATSLATNFTWTPATGLNNPGIANPIASPESTTTYIVTATNGQCSNTDTITVSVINVVADAGFDQTICQGSSAQLNADGGTTYSWSPSTGLNNPNISNPIATPAQTTVYTVTVSVGNCSATETVSVNVNALSAFAGNDISICEGNDVELAGSGTGSNIMYSWSPSAGLSNPFSSNPIATIGTTTTFVLTVSDGLCTASDEVIVNINPNPTVPVITQNGNELTSTGSGVHQWYLDGALIAGANNNTLEITQNGTYTVTITNASGCSSISDGFTVITVTVKENLKYNLTLYPNPVENLLTIEVNTLGNEEIRVELFSVNGQSLKQMNINGTEKIDLSGFAAGVYYVRILNNTEIRPVKFVKL